jgi:ribonucleoside-diphosphate reductase alpha chain
MPEKIDWNKLSEYEKEDNTKSSQTFACTGDVCEVVDIT